MNRIKEFRENNNLSQRQLSNQLKDQGIQISQNSISKYENGERVPSEQKWQQLAAFFNTNVDALKGIGIDQNKAVDKSIKIIHDSYFSQDSSNPVTKQVNQYLTLTDQIDVPKVFYKEKSGEKKLNNKIKDFWISCFKQLFTNENFRQKLTGINDPNYLKYQIAKNIEDLNITELKSKDLYDIFKTYENTNNAIELYISKLSIDNNLKKVLNFKNVTLLDNQGKDITNNFTVASDIENQINFLHNLGYYLTHEKMTSNKACH